MAPEGLARIKGNPRNGKAEVIRWEQITGIRQSMVEYWRGNYYIREMACTLFLQDDATLTLLPSEFKHSEPLIKEIQNQVYAHLYPVLARQYESGQPIRFGYITLSKEGISKDANQRLPWSEIKEIYVRLGFINICKCDGSYFATIPVTNLTNPAIFLEFLNKNIFVKIEDY